MSTLLGILFIPIQVLVPLFCMAVMVRFLLQVVRADFYNPISQALVKITNPVLVPLRKVIPGVGGLDIAAFALLIAVQMIWGVILFLVMDWGMPSIFALLGWSVFALVDLVLWMFFFALLAIVIMSWVAPQSRQPAALLLYQLTEPVIAPVRKVIPPIGGLDLSVLFIFIALRMLQEMVLQLGITIGLPHNFVLWY